MQFSSPLIKVISERIVDLFGLQFPPNRETELMRAVKNTAFQFGCTDDLNEIRHWLCDKKLSECETRELSEQLTINETYFFREKTALELLSTCIVPAIMAKRNINDYPIRIWSAGCSSGEEAYSIAMWLSENFSEINQQNLQIIATDISPKAVVKALKGEYTEWSFRETDPEIRLKYFLRNENKNQIKANVQKFVTISYLNLAKNCFPSPSTNTENFDVIFCRNVLMYFSPDKIKEVNARFYNSLNSDGWLITSQVELNDDYFGIYHRVHFRNGIYYSKNNTLKTGNNINVKLTPVTTERKQLELQKITKNKVTKLITSKVKQIEYVPILKNKKTDLQHVLNSPNDIDTIKELSDKGEYQTAIEKMDTLLHTHKDNADLYYLYANILYETNEIERAEQLLIKTLYLNYNHLDAALLMAYSLKQRKLHTQSIRYFKQAMNILTNKPLDNSNMDHFQLFQMINSEIKLLNNAY
jgi:chemotaxis protein methyltransferase CheR